MLIYMLNDDVLSFLKTKLVEIDEILAQDSLGIRPICPALLTLNVRGTELTWFN